MYIISLFSLKGHIILFRHHPGGATAYLAISHMFSCMVASSLEIPAPQYLIAFSLARAASTPGQVGKYTWVFNTWLACPNWAWNY